MWVKAVTSPRVHSRRWLGRESSYPKLFLFRWLQHWLCEKLSSVSIPRDSDHVSGLQEEILQ